MPTDDTRALADYPGLNPIAVQAMTSAAVRACPNFTPSEHANAHPTGPLSCCIQCQQPQWRHWLREALAALRAVPAEPPALTTWMTTDDPVKRDAVRNDNAAASGREGEGVMAKTESEPVSPFLTFAERCKDVKRVADITEHAFAFQQQPTTPRQIEDAGPMLIAEWQDLDLKGRVSWVDDSEAFGGQGFSTDDLRAFISLAERHARLLAQIERMDRYDVGIGYAHGEPFKYADPAGDGEWVRYSDIKALLEQR